MIFKKKLFLFLIIALSIPVLSYGTYRIGGKIYREANDILSQKDINSEFKVFAERCLEDKKITSSQNKFDHLRHCIHMNSFHSIDEEYRKTERHGKNAFYKNVFEYAKGNLPQKPHLECSRRSMMLTNLLKNISYKARNIVVISKSKNFSDHVIVEVYNPITQAWEIHDPSMDAHYRSTTTNQRININQYIDLPVTDYEPCNYNRKCSWDGISPDKKFIYKFMPRYASAAFLNYQSDNEKGPLLYNPDKLDIINFKSQNEKTYCDTKPAHCKKIINVKEN